MMLARRLYDAFAREDADALMSILSKEFVGTVSDGMPDGVGGVHRGPQAMLTDVWARIAERWDVCPEPDEYLPVVDGRVVVVGRYRGRSRDEQSAVDAVFAHILSFGADGITALHQITDTKQWQVSS